MEILLHIFLESSFKISLSYTPESVNQKIYSEFNSFLILSKGVKL